MALSLLVKMKTFKMCHGDTRCELRCGNEKFMQNVSRSILHRIVPRRSQNKNQAEQKCSRSQAPHFLIKNLKHLFTVIRVLLRLAGCGLREKTTAAVTL